jgi:hypothetical protein
VNVWAPTVATVNKPDSQRDHAVAAQQPLQPTIEPMMSCHDSG